MFFTIEYCENTFILCIWKFFYFDVPIKTALILIPGRVLLRNVVPGPIFNEVFFSLKDDFVSNKVDSTVSRVEVLYLLTRLEVFNPQHQLFSAELEKHLEDCHVDIANGNYSSILEELELNDIFKEAFKVSVLFCSYLFFSSINLNWHERGLLSPCPFWIRFCLLNFHQKFRNFFGGEN